MKKVLCIIAILSWSFAYSSNFEIKVAINLNDCINCSNHLYSLNKVSKKYKITFIYNNELSEDSTFVSEEIIGYKIKDFSIEVSDSLYNLYSAKSQNFVNVFKNNNRIFAFPLKNINSYIDSLNLLSFEDGDTIKIGFKPDIKNKSKLIGNNLYILNSRKNSFYITNTIIGKSAKFNLNKSLISEIFAKAFTNYTQKLIEITDYYKALNMNLEIKINSFDVDSDKLYLFADIPYIEKIERNFLDTFISTISCLLIYKNGEKNPSIYIINNNNILLKDYTLSTLYLSIANGDAIVNVFLKDVSFYNSNSFWVCKCKLQEKLDLELESCLKRPEIHVKQKMDGHFGEYLSSGDYLINTISNELINYQTKSSVLLPLPVNKNFFNKTEIAKSRINFFLNDFQISKNQVHLIYTSDLSYYYMIFDLAENRIIENSILFEDGSTINGAPKFFKNNLYFYSLKNSKNLILKKLTKIDGKN